MEEQVWRCGGLLCQADEGIEGRECAIKTHVFQPGHGQEILRDVFAKLWAKEGAMTLQYIQPGKQEKERDSKYYRPTRKLLNGSVKKMKEILAQRADNLMRVQQFCLFNGSYLEQVERSMYV